MTAPVLAHKKFYIIKPAEGTNQIKNPIFSPPDFEEDWTAFGSGVTIEETGDEQRFASYSMQVNTATGVASSAFYGGLSVVDGLDYTFSFYVKGTDGQTFNTTVKDAAYTIKATATFTATGYWQRVEVTLTSAETIGAYNAWITRDATASTDPFYVDGVQFEQASAATTLIEGYMPGCRWEGYARNSASIRSAQYGLGGEIIDLEDYCHVVQVTGLGHGDWNQILTKMTSGGDMYQTHIRKSRQFSIIVDFIGNSLGEIESNRAAVIDLLRPDRLRGQEMVVRYQGVDVNGNEATNPVDIVCVPLPATLVDTPDLPSYQRAVLNFTIPSGLLNGAYHEGKELDLYANFPAEFIVKRDPQGNWCKWTGAAYEGLMPISTSGLNNDVYCMTEGPDGKIYAGGLFTNAAYPFLARWNPISEAWEAVVSGINSWVSCMAFDANGDLYIGGDFTNVGSTAINRICKITDLSGTPTENTLGTGLNSYIFDIAIAPNGDVYVGGDLTTAGGNAASHIAKWNGTAWSALGSGLDYRVSKLTFAPNGDLYIGGSFHNVAYPHFCKWDGTAFSVVGTNTDINDSVGAIAFGATGWMYVGGSFTDAGGNTNADYIAKRGGNTWEALGTGANGAVAEIVVNSGKVYACGSFTAIGGLTLPDRVAVWSNGTWAPLDINLPGIERVRAIVPASDGSLYIAGEFSTTNDSENAKTGMVALNLNVSSASANTYPFMQVRGPGTLKAITNYSTGKSVMFDGLTLNAGEWINLHFDPLNLQFYGGWAGRGNLMRYIMPGSDYGDFYLMPGRNLLSLFMTDSTTDSGAFMSWTPLFWGIDGALL